MKTIKPAPVKPAITMDEYAKVDIRVGQKNC